MKVQGFGLAKSWPKIARQDRAPRPRLFMVVLKFGDAFGDEGQRMGYLRSGLRVCDLTTVPLRRV